MWVSKQFILPESGQGQGKRSWGWGESRTWSLIYKTLHFLMETKNKAEEKASQEKGTAQANAYNQGNAWSDQRVGSIRESNRK